jgi:dGTPase
MLSLEERLHKANTLLAPFAVPLGGTLGREHEEKSDETRFPFQRDRDRIIHTREFRRLKGKTQVFVAGEGDHFRTRLTHTMEVAQISRDIARTLGLNEDLAECIALAHDLGHPPFAHAGEQALDQWMRSHGSSFEHNDQSLRIVTVIADHAVGHTGLNLNKEVLEGLQKHRTPHDHPDQAKKNTVARSPSLEAQVVNIADEIAYTAHDIDDGLRADFFTMEMITRQPLAKDAAEISKKRGTSLRGAVIHLLVTDLYRATEEELRTKNIQSLDNVYAAHDSLVRFSPETDKKLTELRTYLEEQMYRHPTVKENNENGQRLIIELCNRYLENPHPKITELMKKHSSTLVESIKDYVAGMTDAFAKKSREAVE